MGAGMIKINLAKPDIIQGDCLEVLKLIPDNSVDSIVTDPPYGLSFMGKKWDYDVPTSEVFKECLRVLKPGGHALIACGTRTQHRMAVNIEDAGFEIRDVVTWLYGSGFPKSHNLKDGWQGWGTALKPACEFWTLARKPLSEKTVASNVLRHGTGGINVDGCRVEGVFESGWSKTGSRESENTSMSGKNYARDPKPDNSSGRWPANLILDEEAAKALDEQSGTLKSGARNGVKSERVSFGESGTFKENARDTSYQSEASQGGASRFFYVAKASKSERNAGCEDLPDAKLARSNGAKSGNNDNNPDYNEDAKSGYDKIVTMKNNHPTVKPIKLMTYLCRLITPPNGIVLDPFAGSGSTGVAAIKEGFGFIGIEREKEYVEIAKARIENAS
jgi:site-specific DNA-methyltransferase (adenine-specific)